MLAESYRILQVPFGAQMPQIRQAYRRLVLQYHPDRNAQPGAQETFLQIQAAYEYLQRFHVGGSPTVNPTGPSSPASPPPQPQTDWEKYQHVYEPPTDPQAYAAWAAVARERVRRQKAKDQEAYVQRTQAMKRKWWYPLARYSSYVVLGLGMLVGATFISIPLYFLLAGHFKPSLLGIIMVPMGVKIVLVMFSFRHDIRVHFGEDLPNGPS